MSILAVRVSFKEVIAAIRSAEEGSASAMLAGAVWLLTVTEDGEEGAERMGKIAAGGDQAWGAVCLSYFLLPGGI